MATKKSSKAKAQPAKKPAARTSAPAVARKPAVLKAKPKKPVAKAQYDARVVFLAVVFFLLSLVFYAMAYWRYHVG